MTDKNDSTPTKYQRAARAELHRRNRTPEGLAKLWHEATRSHDVGLAPWAEQPEWARERGIAIASDVLAKMKAVEP